MCRVICGEEIAAGAIVVAIAAAIACSVPTATKHSSVVVRRMVILLRSRRQVGHFTGLGRLDLLLVMAMMMMDDLVVTPSCCCCCCCCWTRTTLVVSEHAHKGSRGGWTAIARPVLGKLSAREDVAGWIAQALVLEESREAVLLRKACWVVFVTGRVIGHLGEAGVAASLGIFPQRARHVARVDHEVWCVVLFLPR